VRKKWSIAAADISEVESASDSNKTKVFIGRPKQVTMTPSDAKIGVRASPVIVVAMVIVASLMGDVGVVLATHSDTRCGSGQIVEHGTVLGLGNLDYVLVCDDGYEASPSDAVVTCHHGVIVVEESSKCVPIDADTSSVTIRKIRSAEHTKSGKQHVHLEAGTKRHRKLKAAGTDADGQRKNRRKMFNRRRKINIQADEGASAVPGEAVQWRSYGNDVVGEKLGLEPRTSSFSLT